MKILLPQIHPGFTCMLCRCPHDFYVRRGFNPFPGDQWKDSIRPKPGNLAIVPANFSGPVDLAVTAGGQDLPPTGVPYVYLQLWDSAPAMDPVAHNAAAWVFLSDAVSWMMNADRDTRTSVIEYGIDPAEHGGWTGGGPAVAVGHHLRGRGDKGYWNLAAVCRRHPVAVLGYGNEGLPDHRYIDSYPDYLSFLRTASVFYNPSPWVPMSAIEAMVMGIPVVQTRPLNYRNLFLDCETCLVVDGPDEALDAILRLQARPKEALEMGNRARNFAARRFSLTRFIYEWNAVFGRSFKEKAPR